MKTSVIPFGPQHPVLPEPLQFKLTVEDEVVTEAVPALGYFHCGLETLASSHDFHQMVQVTERVCGICSVLHAICYCQGVKAIMGIDVPPRAHHLRTIWGELLRLHSHLLWMGLFADSFGFEGLFMQLWKIRERILDIQEATTGNRVISGAIRVGGVCRDIDAQQGKWIMEQLEWVGRQVKLITPVLRDDFTIRARTMGKGVLSADQTRELGAVGPVLRASGIASAVRKGSTMFKMTPRILVNLFAGPATRDYPRQVRPPYPATRGRLVNDIAQCTFCGACAAKCPPACLAVDPCAPYLHWLWGVRGGLPPRTACTRNPRVVLLRTATMCWL